MKIRMKRILSMVLAIIMLLPLITSMVFAEGTAVTADDSKVNVAPEASFSIAAGVEWAGWMPQLLVDGKKDVGTYSPKGRNYTISMNLSKATYISDFVVAINREGQLPEYSVGNTYAKITRYVKIEAYKGDNLVFKTDSVLNTESLQEVSVQINQKVTRVDFIVPQNGNNINGVESIWEIEAFTEASSAGCDAEQKNIAAEAQISSPQTWWACKLETLVDGNEHYGTHSPKGGQYSIYFDFGAERYIASTNIICNGYGKEAAEGKEVGNIENKEVYYTGMSITVKAYNFNDDLVFESDKVDASTITELSIDVAASASRIEFFISDAGAAGQSGANYFWEAMIYEETGSHDYKEVMKENPSCAVPGYIGYQCSNVNCGATKKEVIEATGFHIWNEGEEITPATVEANGNMLYTCIVCDTTVERDIPALNHNWNGGTVVPNSCDDEGYTEYKCLGCDVAGCTAKYKGNFTFKLGHDFDDGTVEKIANIEETGKIVYRCLREGCDGKKEKILRKAKYTDSTFVVDNSLVDHYDGTHNVSELGSYVFDGKVDGNFWCAPGDCGGGTRNSGKLEIYFNQEYYFTTAKIYVSSNWNWFEVHFMYQEGGEWKTSATYAHDRAQCDTAMFDMSINLGIGARASKVVIESVGRISGGTAVATHWQYPDYAGSGLRYHEIELTAHKCNITEDCYEDESKWNKPTCTQDGSCKATCPICGLTQTVTLSSEKYGHNYGDFTVTKQPTCSVPGVGTKKCITCGTTSGAMEVPATGIHTYENYDEFMAPECIKPGVGQHKCKECARVSYVYPVDATGVHIYPAEGIIKSHPNYTATGKTIFACKYCGLDEGKDPIITEKTPMPENFVTFEGFELRATGFVGIRASFKYDTAILEELQKTCDVTISIKATNANGESRSVEVYGKRGTQKYDAETGEFAVALRVPSCVDEYTFSYEVKLMNFRGTVTQEFSLENATTSVYDLATAALDTAISGDLRKLCEEIAAEK